MKVLIKKAGFLNELKKYIRGNKKPNDNIRLGYSQKPSKDTIIIVADITIKQILTNFSDR